MRFLGSRVNIFLIKSFAAAEIEGHGALSRSSLPSKIDSNMALSVSKIVPQIKLVKQ